MLFSPKIIRSSVCCALSLFLLLTALVGPEPAPAAQSHDRELARQFQAILKGARAASKAPGAMAGVWKGSFAWTSAQGLANVAQKIPMRTSQVWRIGSVSKTFTATVALKALRPGIVIPGPESQPLPAWLPLGRQNYSTATFAAQRRHLLLGRG